MSTFPDAVAAEVCCPARTQNYRRFHPVGNLVFTIPKQLFAIVWQKYSL